uniref:G-protein coupled receptors family 1 profile domain-containing protein n=1 Tax=Plectus sambesii TaxID=2011161 RepID=A0A914W0E3_9BILA
MNNTLNATACSEDLRLSFASTRLEFILMGWIFPAQFCIGVLGSIINLSVLLSKNMRNRANDLLSGIAFADIGYLLCSLPQSLAIHEFFATSVFFRTVYFASKMHLNGLINWFLAMAMWLIFAVTIERLHGIRSPLRSRMYWNRQTMVMLFLVVITATGLLTAYHHFAFDCSTFVRMACDRAKQILIHVCVDVTKAWPHNSSNLTNPHSVFFKNLIRFSSVFSAFIVGVIPITAVACLNIVLLYQLHKRKAQPLIRGESKWRRDVTLLLRQERRITVIVVTIVTSYTLTQGLPAIVYLWQLFNQDTRIETIFFLNNITCLCNSLMITGKASNFFLYCMCSKNFRNEILLMLQKLLPRNIVRKLPRRYLPVVTIESDAEDIRLTSVRRQTASDYR